MQRQENKQNKEQKKVVILGAGGHAKVIAEIITKSGDEVLGFLDDNKDIQGNEIYLGKKVLGTTHEEDVERYKNNYFVIGIGSNKIRKIISNKYPSLKWYTAVHPSSIIATDVTIGDGSVVMPGAIINPGTKIGNHVIVNTGVTIDHDNIIGDYVHISPGAHLAGTVKVGEQTWICTGVTIVNNITIGKNNIIGAGATVIRNIEQENSTFIGVPAKKIVKEKED